MQDSLLIVESEKKKSIAFVGNDRYSHMGKLLYSENDTGYLQTVIILLLSILYCLAVHNFITYRYNANISRVRYWLMSMR